MADLPYMMMNWGRFFSDAKVAMMPPDAQGIYALLLGRMWLNEGWLSADDKVICRILGLDLRAWRHTYKPLIVPLLSTTSEPYVGAIYTQKHLQEVRASALATVAKTQASTARARAAKAAKHGRAPSVTERKHAPATKPATETVTEPVAGSNPASKQQPQQKESSTLHVESFLSDAVPSTLAALPPREQVEAKAERSALDGALGLEGRLPPMPSAEGEQVERSGLTKRLVAEGLKPKRGLLGSLDMGKR